MHRSYSHYREQTNCPACGQVIGLGYLMCWSCFKGEYGDGKRADGKTPYKWWPLPPGVDVRDETACVDAWIAYTKEPEPAATSEPAQTWNSVDTSV